MKRLVAGIQGIAWIAVLFSVGCASSLMDGSDVHRGPTPAAIASYTVSQCVRADGKILPLGGPINYKLAQEAEGLVLYEQGHVGHPARIDNYWRDEQGDNFFTAVKLAGGWHYVIPQDRSQPAIRWIYTKGYSSGVIGGALKVVAGEPTGRCEMTPSPSNPGGALAAAAPVVPQPVQPVAAPRPAPAPASGGQQGISTENTARTCRDGVDNDGDGHIDCADQDCGQLTFCAQREAKSAQPQIVLEDSTVTCQDRADNDGDGHIDCFDQDCWDFVFCANRRPAKGSPPAPRKAQAKASAEIRATVVKAIPAIQGCYSKSSAPPEFVNLRIRVYPGGTSVLLSASPAPPSAAYLCVRGAVGNMRFPPRHRGQIIITPKIRVAR